MTFRSPLHLQLGLSRCDIEEHDRALPMMMNFNRKSTEGIRYKFWYRAAKVYRKSLIVQ